MWAPLIPPATYTPKVTAIAHPQVISSQSPLAAKIAVPRPDWFSAATAIATTPSPKQMSTKVPRNSADSSPQTVCRQRGRARAAPVARAVAVISPPLFVSGTVGLWDACSGTGGVVRECGCGRVDNGGTAKPRRTIELG